MQCRRNRLRSRTSGVRISPGAPSLSSVFNKLKILWLRTPSPLSPVFDLQQATLTPRFSAKCSFKSPRDRTDRRGPPMMRLLPSTSAFAPRPGSASKFEADNRFTFRRLASATIQKQKQSPSGNSGRWPYSSVAVTLGTRRQGKGPLRTVRPRDLPAN